MPVSRADGLPFDLGTGITREADDALVRNPAASVRSTEHHGARGWHGVVVGECRVRGADQRDQFRPLDASPASRSDPLPVPPDFRVGVTLVPKVPLTGTVDGAGNIQTSTGVSLGSITDPIDRQADSLLDPPLDQVRLFADRTVSRGRSTPRPGPSISRHREAFTFAGNESGHDYECTTSRADLHLHSSDDLDGSGSITLSSSPTSRSA